MPPHLRAPSGKELDELFKEIGAVYTEMAPSDAPGLRPRDQGQGFWRPTTLGVLEQEVARYGRLGRKATYDFDAPTLLPGSGDGRRAAFLAGAGYTDLTGIEVNTELVDASNRILDELARRELISRGTITILGGDCMDDAVYDTGGRSFRDYTQIFAYLRQANADRLVQKIENESPIRTQVGLLQPIDWENPKTSLQLIEDRLITAGGPYRTFLRYEKVQS